MNIKKYIDKIITEEVRKVRLKESTISFDKIIPGKTKIKYILPGSTGSETSTGLVVDKNSTRTEDYLIVLDDKTKKKSNVFMNRVSDIIESRLKESSSQQEIENLAVDLIDYMGKELPPRPNPRILRWFQEAGIDDQNLISQIYKRALQLNAE